MIIRILILILAHSIMRTILIVNPRSMADRSGTEITEYHSYMYAESHGTRYLSTEKLEKEKTTIKL